MTQTIAVVPAEEIQQIKTDLARVLELVERQSNTTNTGWQRIAECAQTFNVTTKTVNEWVKRGQWEARGVGQMREVRRAT